MSIDANSIVAAVLEGVAEKAPEDARATAGGGTTTEFCTFWPKAKPVLVTAVTILSFLPGPGAIAAGVLTGLIKVGDQLTEQLCG